MKRRRTIWIAGLMILVIGGLVLKSLFSPKNLLEKYDREIQNLKEEIGDMNRSISEYYKSKGKIQPKYPFLVPDKTEKLKQLTDKMFVLKKKLARDYEQKGDYYLDELYRLDKNSPDKYKKYASVGIQDFRNAILSEQPIAKEVIQMMIQTRQRALNNYHFATKALDDETSDLYELIKNFPPILLEVDNKTPLKMINRVDPLSQSLIRNQKVRNEYLKQRVKGSLHYKKGKSHYQQAIFIYYGIVSKRKKNRDDLTDKNINNIALHIATSSIKKQFNLAEKEFLITLGVNRRHSLAIYDLAKLYADRYERALGTKSLLKKAEILLKKLISLSLKNKTKKVKHEKAFFLLGRVYYLMGRKKEAQSIYKDLMGVFSEGSTLFNNAARNYNRIKRELLH